MTNAIQQNLSRQITVLKERVSSSNLEANTDGLLAHLFLGSIDSELDWQVNCCNARWLDENTADVKQGHMGKLAALGYSLAEYDYSDDMLSSVFAEGLFRLKSKDAFPGDQISFPNIPSVFLGIALGAASLPESQERRSLIEWLSQVLKELRSRRTVYGFSSMLYEYIDSILGNKSVFITQSIEKLSVSELCFLEWGRRNGVFNVVDPESFIGRTREEILTRVSFEDLEVLTAPESAIVWAAVSECISSSIHDLILSPSHVIQILNRFESSMKRWRWDDGDLRTKVFWPIISEREVQDIVWLILRSVFDDVVDEESLPKFGQKSYKPDFAIPSNKTLVEVKFVRNRRDFAKVEEEIMIDSIAYLQETTRFNRLVVFIYDDSSSVQMHSTTKDSLRKIPGIEGVVIASRPSQLPTITRQTEIGKKVQQIQFNKREN